MVFWVLKIDLLYQKNVKKAYLKLKTTSIFFGGFFKFGLCLNFISNKLNKSSGKIAANNTAIFLAFFYTFPFTDSIWTL